MNTLTNVKAGVIAVFALLVLPMAVQAAITSRSSSETIVTAVVHIGDKVIVNTDDTPLMIDRKVLARLNSGREFTVTAIQDMWLGTSLEIDGKCLSGWVRSTGVMLARNKNHDEARLAEQTIERQSQTGGPQFHMAFRPVISESDSQAVARNCITPTEKTYGPGEWDFNWSGHHEPDPNIHTWEPWRHNY